MPNDWKTETQPILEEVRSMIRRSEHSQRQVERLAGFSKGYLSQLLAQNLDLKVWHLLAILDVFDVSVADFFALLDSTAELPPSLAAFERDRSAVDEQLDRTLDDLYGMDVDGLARLRRRLVRQPEPAANFGSPAQPDEPDEPDEPDARAPGQRAEPVR